jgi:SAM-dependent methyltransferase
MAPPQSPANTAQIEFWNGPTGQRWTRLATQIEDNLRPFADALLRSLGPKPGERIVDVGCGAGDTTLSLAERVQGHGFVLGVDISRPMLQRATARAANTPEYPVRFVEADAAGHAFERGAFDALFSRFGVMFFADSARAFANLRRALRRGGRVSFACWRAIPENPWVTVPLAAIAKVVVPPPAPPPGAPGPFSFGDPERVRGILAEAGFTEIELAPHDGALTLGTGLDDAVEFVLSAGPASRLLEGASESDRARARSVVGEALAPHARGGPVALTGAIWLVRAKNPD